MYRRCQRWMLIIHNRFLSLDDYIFLLENQRLWLKRTEENRNPEFANSWVSNFLIPFPWPLVNSPGRWQGYRMSGPRVIFFWGVLWSQSLTKHITSDEENRPDMWLVTVATSWWRIWQTGLDAQPTEHRRENNGWASYVPSGYILHDSTD